MQREVESFHNCTYANGVNALNGLAHIAWLDAALKLKSELKRSRSNGSAPDGTRARTALGDAASTRVEPLDQKGGARCDCQPNPVLPDTRHAASCSIYKGGEVNSVTGVVYLEHSLAHCRDQFLHNEAKKPDCQGSYLQKTACKACFRCTQEKSMLFRNYRLGFRTYQEMLDLDFKPLELEGALNDE